MKDWIVIILLAIACMVTFASPEPRDARVTQQH